MTNEVTLTKEPDGMYGWDCPECGTRVWTRTRPGPDSLDAALAEAEAALPQGCNLTLQTAVTAGYYRAAVVLVHPPMTSRAMGRDAKYIGGYPTADGSTPAAALRALAERLKERAG